MKILMVSNQVKGYTLGFRNIIEPFCDLGHEVIWAANFSNFAGNKDIIPCRIEHIDIVSNPIKSTNFRAFHQLEEIVKRENVDALFCSTPIGGLLGRLVAKKKKIKPVIYAAHGFLFFKGAKLINRTIYKWEEQLLAGWTDALITINQEDYNAAQQLKLRNSGKVFMIHGAGVEVGKHVNVSKKRKREELNINEDAFVIVSAGFLNPNKNNKVIVQAVSELKNKNVVYVVCGEGEKEQELRALSNELGVKENVLFLGFRQDMAEIMAASDCFVMPSFREGVPRALLEAMDLGIPCVGSRTRGITELIGENEGGYLCDPHKPHEFAEAFLTMMEKPEVLEKMKVRNQKEVLKYSKDIVYEETVRVFQETLK